MKNHKREEYFEAFDAWAKEHGVTGPGETFCVEKYEEGGYGLKALKDLKVNTCLNLFLNVCTIHDFSISIVC